MKKRTKSQPVNLEEDLGESTDTGSQVHHSYGVVKTGTELSTYIDDIAENVRSSLEKSIAVLTPWFFNNMPRIYYQTTPRAEKVRHLSAIITGHVFETKQTVELWDRDRSKVTYIGPGGDGKILTEMAHRFGSQQMKMGSLHFSRDKVLFLSTFFCSTHSDLDMSNPLIMEKVEGARTLLYAEFPDDRVAIDKYLAGLDNEFVVYATAERIELTYRMVHHMSKSEGAHTFVEPFEGSNTARLMLGMKDTQPADVLEQVIDLIDRYEFNVERAFIARFDRSLDQPISVMHFIISARNGEKITTDLINLRKLSKALRTVPWVDADNFATLTREPYGLSLNGANFIRAAAAWINIFLGKENQHYYSSYTIQQSFFKHADFTRALSDWFRIKFDPREAQARSENKLVTQKQKLVAMAEEVIDEIERDILKESINFVDHTLKTNYFLPTKTGLAFRISSDVLDSAFYQQKPFGIFFTIGRDFRCFHVRWRDIARGGLRVVMPKTPADYEHAFAGLFDEVYGLSGAQQLKNKDIPEGGSKAVLLLKPGGNRDRAVRGAVNSILDLLVSMDESHEETAKNQLDYYKKPEIIYLGPDENITNELIEWVSEQATRRGYRYARAFMSSKPGDGINHKEYGVTSEGLNVFAHNMLNYLKIDPKKESFTVKITGGPDGDVAGNELKILHREYGDNARVVAIADGFGAASDPQGLQWSELLRLFREGKPISEFNPKYLSKSKDAFVIKADSKENIRTRNELHFKVPADLFIPAGGRPYTVNDKNWQMFMGADGTPTVRAIVEGANIFFTSGAREKLQQSGVLIIKDSSANKTGVICSSYEIIASLTLSRDEFLEIKAQYVDEVIAILRKKADMEAKLLFREFRKAAGTKNLVDLSMAISKEINEVKDAVLEGLAPLENEVQTNPHFESLIFAHCPAILVAKYSARILERLPVAHKIAILAAYMASNIVYREGLGWLDQIPKDQRFKVASTYMRKDQISEHLVAAVEGSGIADKDQIAAILRMSAARDLTLIDIEK